MNRNETSAAAPIHEIEHVAGAQADARDHQRNDERRQRGEAVVGGEQHADPVGAFVVGGRGRIAAAEVHARSPPRSCRSTSRTARTTRRTGPGRAGASAPGIARMSAMIWTKAPLDRVWLHEQQGDAVAEQAAGQDEQLVGEPARARSSSAAPPPATIQSSASRGEADRATSAATGGRHHRRTRAPRADIRACAARSSRPRRTGPRLRRRTHSARSAESRPAGAVLATPKRVSSHGSRLATTAPTPMKKLCIA